MQVLKLAYTAFINHSIGNTINKSLSMYYWLHIALFLPMLTVIDFALGKRNSNWCLASFLVLPTIWVSFCCNTISISNPSECLHWKYPSEKIFIVFNTGGDALYTDKPYLIFLEIEYPVHLVNIPLFLMIE